MLTVERDLLEQTVNNLDGSGSGESAVNAPRHNGSNTEIPMIVDALSQCASAFVTDRARFIRQTASGDWTVHTLHQGSVTSHVADRAEIAMAWMVGLSRFPIRVTRPRVTQADGSGIRPIAVTGYLGIPVLCQNHFAGVIELAGGDTGALERVLDGLNETLARLGYRLVHDPAIRASQRIDMDVECVLSGGFWNPNEVMLDAEEWSVLSIMGAPTVLRDAACTLSMSEERLIDIIHSLVSRGLVSVRTTTRTLSATSGRERISPDEPLEDGGE